jgi:hypothetical protein
MKKTTSEEARKTIESVTTPFHVGFFAVLVFVSALLALYGFFAGISTETWSHANPDKYLLLMLVGVSGFIFSFPTMMCLYVAHLVLSRLRKLEEKLDAVA